MSKTFALAGVGYISQKHLEAIKNVGGELVAACDLHDSVGILDRYFPKTKFFLNPAEFKEAIRGVDYLSICTPNDTHTDYIQMGADLGIGLICEKPLVSSYELLERVSEDVNVIMQLRLHPDAKKLVNDRVVEIEYITPRGEWYSKSWKGNQERSGGLLMNIGIHLFDLIHNAYGPYNDGYDSLVLTEDTSIGTVIFKRAIVRWRLSTKGDKVSRIIKVGDEKLNFTDTEGLHTLSYEKILKGEGFKKKDVEAAIKFVHKLYNKGKDYSGIRRGSPSLHSIIAEA